MCGRFRLSISQNDIEEFKKLIDDIDYKFKNIKDFSSRDFHPSENALVMTKDEASIFQWGFPMDDKIIINGRSEGIQNKKTFKNLISENRCIIPINSFYEWKNGVKYEISSDDKCIFLAGLHRKYIIQDQVSERFIILTCAANEDMKKIHDRMPVIVAPQDVREFILGKDNLMAINLLKTNPLSLNITNREDEQISFF